MEFPSQDDLIATPATLDSAQQADQDRVSAALDFVYDIRKDFLERDKLIASIHDVLFLQKKVNIPDNFKASALEVQTPLPPYIANQVVAALSINSPKVQYKATEFGDIGEDLAYIRQTFFENSFLRQQQEKQRPTFRLGMYDVITKGTGVWKTHERKNRAWAKYTGPNGYAATLLKELDQQLADGMLDQNSHRRLFDGKTEEYKRGLPYPIETSDIPPETFYWQMGEDGMVRAVEAKIVPCYTTLKKFHAAFNEQGQVVFDDVANRPVPDYKWGEVTSTRGWQKNSVEMIEIWDYKTCKIILRGPGDIIKNRSGKGLQVIEFEHGYGNEELMTLRGPYFVAPGVLTSSRKPHEAHLSILFAYLHLFPLLNSLLTMQNQAAFNFSYPAYRRTTPPNYQMPSNPFASDAADLHGNRQKIVPGSIFPHDIAAIDQPHTSIDLDKAISFVRSLIDLALPNVVQGNVTGEMVGYTMNQAAHQATLQWTPIVDNTEMALSARTSFESWLIENRIGEPVYVWGAIPQPRRRSGAPVQYKDGWISMGPNDLKGIHNYYVHLETSTVTNDQLELRVLQQELEMRLIDPASAIKKRGRNPVDVERAWLLYMLKQDPLIIKAMQQRIFAGLALTDQETMSALPPGGEPGGTPPPPTSGQMVAAPGISQGLPTTGFVQPAGGGAPPPAPTGNAPPGPVPGSPAGVRNTPGGHEQVPGGG